MTDYDVALTIYDRLPAGIARVELEEIRRIISELDVDDSDDWDDIDAESVADYINSWLKEV